MPPQKTMTQDEVRSLIYGTSKPQAVGEKSQGRYGKRHVIGQMNQTEKSYSEELEKRKLAGDILEWFFEPGSWRYAKDARFTPDFLIFHANGSLEFVDVKGGIENEASVCRGKACADKFWMFTFSKVRKLKKTDGGGWERTVY